MSFLKKLTSIFTGPGRGGQRMLTVYVLSTRCQEPLQAEIDLLNALSQSDDPDSTYYTRKVIQGSGRNRCFTQVEVELWFDGNKNILRHQVSGGRWLTAEEYQVELERFNAPPEEEAEEDGPAAGGGEGGFG